MQNDEVIWQVINQNFCSFKVKYGLVLYCIDLPCYQSDMQLGAWDGRTLKQNFCKNEHNITGLCNRQSCPLANSRYATVIEKDGVYFLPFQSRAVVSFDSDTHRLALPARQVRFTCTWKLSNVLTLLCTCGKSSSYQIIIARRYNRLMSSCRYCRFSRRRPSIVSSLSCTDCCVYPCAHTAQQYWPKFLIHKSKQRLTKITQFLMKMRKIKLSVQYVGPM